MTHIKAFSDKGLELEQVAKIASDLANRPEQLIIPEGTTREVFAAETETMLRDAFKELTYKKGRFSKNMYEKNKYEIFAILDEILEPAINLRLDQILLDFAEVKNASYGDVNSFNLIDNQLFKVTAISDGNWNIRRQKEYGGSITLPMERLGIKVYEELNRFIDGSINWNRVVDKISISMAVGIATRAFQALTSTLNFDLAATSNTGAFDEVNFLEMLHDIHEQTGLRPVIYGTPRALAKIEIDRESPEMREERSRNLGYYGMFRGYEIIEIPFEAVGEDAQNDLFILPVGLEKPIKVFVDNQNDTVYEGKSQDRLDEQIELFVAQYVGVAAFRPSIYAAYRINA